MSIIADVILASAQQASQYDASEDCAAVERIELNDITELEVSVLWSIIDEVEFDFDEHELEFVDSNEEINLYLFPDSLIFSLAKLNKGEIESFSAEWADIEEMQWPHDRALEVLTSLVSLAQKAKAQAKSLYLWSSL
jgi:hypothetical protein